MTTTRTIPQGKEASLTWWLADAARDLARLAADLHRGDPDQDRADRLVAEAVQSLAEVLPLAASAEALVYGYDGATTLGGTTPGGLVFGIIRRYRQPGHPGYQGAAPFRWEAHS